MGNKSKRPYGIKALAAREFLERLALKIWHTGFADVSLKEGGTLTPEQVSSYLNKRGFEAKVSGQNVRAARVKQG